MPDDPAQRAALIAILELEDKVRISGELTPATEGSFQLTEAQLLSGASSDGKVSLRPGCPAKLSLQGNEESTVAVRVRGITSDTLTLELEDPASKAAHDLLVLTSPARRYSGTPLTGATQEYSQLLNALRDQSLAEMEDLLDPALKELKSYLLELSTRIKPTRRGRLLHYEAAVIIRANRATILDRIIAELAGHYEDLVPEKPDEAPEHLEEVTDLDLIDLQDFEDRLAVDRMVAMGNDLHQIPLEALQIRIATLIEADPVRVRVPVGVAALCRAFQGAMVAFEVPREVTGHIFDFFQRYVIRHLGTYYKGLNKPLDEQGIKPGLEQEIRIKGSLLPRKERPRAPDRPKRPSEVAAEREEETQTLAEIAANLAAASAATTGLAGAGAEHVSGAAGAVAGGPGTGVATGPLPSFSPENLYRSVVDAMNFKREAQGMTDGEAIAAGTPMSGTWEGATVPASEVNQDRLADARAIAAALGAMQRDAAIQEAVRNSNSLREYLASNRGDIKPLKDTEGLTAESLNQLDLVDNLFGTIKSQLDVTSELQPALHNLQIPLAKLALLDPRFFVDRGHSAREVVDKLTQLSTSANFPNKALEDRINRVVDDLVADYESDSSVFDRALGEINKLAEQQERALSRNVERVVRIQEGQEKLQRARLAVRDEINQRIKPPAAPRVLLDLVESGWRDLMVLTHVKEGGDSAGWAEHLKTLDLLLDWLSEQQQGEIDEDLRMQRGLEAETLIEMIGQQIATALPTNVSHQSVLDELREMLTGNLQVDTTNVTGEYGEPIEDPARVRARIEDLPRLRRWVRRVEELDTDTWLTYRDKEGQKRRMQLAWISEAKDRYIFVNERGQKVADLSAIQLARQLARGMQPPAPTDKLSVVDQSMYQTLEHVQKTLSFARNHDDLTSLINKDTFLSQMERALYHAQRRSAQHAVLYLDIDQFSLVNEVYDQVTGDQVLLEFSKLLSQLHGKKSSSARVEDDAFAILLLDRELEQAEEAAEKIRSDIEAGSLEIEGEKVSFTVSIGVAPILEYSPDVTQVLEAASAAASKAKEQGRNQVVCYDEDQARAGAYSQEKTRTREDLEQALATERFVLRAQPIVKTSIDGRALASRHYELLLGLRNDRGGIESPEEFIASAERYGFMHLVDRWVVREAFSWISMLMDEQKEVPHLAINLSGSSVTDDDFMEYLLEQVSEFGVGTSRICFEITETGTISNLVKAADFVRTFRNIGCKFSIDDFGTGLASHNYLRELPVDYVKIDGTFVTGINTNRNDYAMARSINDLAHFLGQETIAESVENDGIIEKLREIGVDYLQGWGVGKPKPLAKVTEDLSNLEK